MPIKFKIFEIFLILLVLGVTIFLFENRIFLKIDFTAILIMVFLGILNQVPNINLFSRSFRFVYWVFIQCCAFNYCSHDYWRWSR
ncbi:MAG: hypothetical protein CM15mP85_15850 [Rhodobacterales bacterium]|nr:MAG: hypothetical protein CM15mP85_15850 [Rhodobacterales bacterium]